MERLTSRYVAYGEENKTIKKGSVTYESSSDADEEVISFCEAVVDDVGHELYDSHVVGIRGE